MKSEIPYPAAHRISLSVKRQIPLMEATDTDSTVNKGWWIQTEYSAFNLSSSWRNRNFKEAANYDSSASFQKTDSGERKLKKEEAWFVIDRYKKLQCSWQLKRLVLHRDGKDFKLPPDRKDLDLKVPDLNPMEIIKSKLEKGFYYETDEFAADIRLMFSDAMLYFSPKNEMHRRAKRLRELFEKNWKSIKYK